MSTPSDSELAVTAVDRVPEHELRRLLTRIAVTHPRAVREGIDRMYQFDRIRRTP